MKKTAMQAKKATLDARCPTLKVLGTLPDKSPIARVLAKCLPCFEANKTPCVSNRERVFKCVLVSSTARPRKH